MTLLGPCAERQRADLAYDRNVAKAVSLLLHLTYGRAITHTASSRAAEEGLPRVPWLKYTHIR
jgi:hypothetical protein